MRRRSNTKITGGNVLCTWAAAIGLSGAACGGVAHDAEEIAVAASQPILGGAKLAPGNPGLTSAVTILYAGAQRCTGTLIASDLVLTAAHCLDDVSAADLSIFFGESTAEQDAALVRPVAQGARYKPTSRSFPHFDIAWVSFTGAAPAGFAPAEILRDHRAMPPASPVTLVGSGNVETICDLLHLADCNGTRLTVDARVRAHFDTVRARGMFTTGPTIGKGTCSGDSGGPAYAQVGGKWYVAGVLSGAESRLTPEAFPRGRFSCEAGTSIHTFAGAYFDWLQSSSGRTLLTSPENPPHEVLVPEPAKSVSSFAEYCAKPDLEFEAWHTVDQILADAETLDCAEAEARIRRSKRVALASSGIVDLSPLGWLPYVEELELYDNPIVDVAPLARLPRLRSLGLEKNRGVTSVAALAGLTDLRDLNLSATSVTDLTPLATLRGLRSLDLHAMAGVDVTTIQRLTTLERLNLASTRLTAMPDLSALTALQVLDVSFNGIIDAGPIASLASLRELTATGAKFATLAPLATMPRLEALSLRGASTTALDALAGMDRLERLDLAETKLEDLGLLAGLDRLRALDLSGLAAASMAFAAPDDVMLPCGIRKLTLNDLGLMSLPFVAPLRDIEELSAAGNALSDAAPLARKSRLRALNLARNPLTDTQALGTLRGLETLDLSVTGIKDVGFVARLRNLTSLSLGFNAIADVSPIARARKLTFLELSQNPLTTLAPLRTLTRLEVLRLYFWNVPRAQKVCPLPPLDGVLNVCEYGVGG